MIDPNALPLDNQDNTNGTIGLEQQGELTQEPEAAPAGLSDEEWLKLGVEAYTGSTQYFDTAIRSRLVDDLRQFQSRHPSGSKYESDAYRARSKFFRPKTRAAVRKNEATAAEAFFSSNDVITVKAHDEDNPLERASAAFYQELLQHRLTHTIPWFLTSVGAYQDAQVQGMVCSYQYWDYRQNGKVDQPCMKLIPLENIRFDPSCDWRDPVNSSPYFIELIPMYAKDVMARTKDFDGKTGEAPWKPVSETALLKASSMYNDVVRMQREQGRVDPHQGRSSITAFTIVWVHRNIVEVNGQDWVFHTLGNEALLDTPRPIEQAYFHGKRPYVIGCCVVETHTAYKNGPVRLGRDVQQELNQNANQRIDNVSFAMNKRYLVKRSAQVDLRSLQRNVPGSGTLVNDTEKDVKVIETNDVTASAYEEQDRLNLDFDDLTGSFSQASVQANRKLNETVGGMNILTKDASALSAYQLRTFVETWAEPVLRQLLLLEARYETDVVIMGLAAAKADMAVRFGVDQVTDELLLQELALNINVGVGATSPHDQLQNFIQGMTALKEMLADGVLQSYGLDVGEVFKEFFGKLGYKDGKRFFPGDQDPTITALQGQIQKLQQAIEAKHPPELLAAMVKKALAEATKTGVDTLFAATQAAEVISAVPQVAPVADQLMVAAGYQPPNPAGVDPNLPQPAGEGAIGVEDVKNRRTGMTFTPGAPGGPAPGDTSPTTPAAPPQPARPGVGAAHGIETMRADSVGAQP
jgi:hypothetical protein